MIQSKVEFPKRLRRQGLTKAEYMVLNNMATYADADGRNARPSVGTMALDLGLHEDTVNAALKSLQAKGWIRLTKPGGGGGRGRGRPNTWEVFERAGAALDSKAATDAQTPCEDQPLPPGQTGGLEQSLPPESGSFTPRTTRALPPERFGGDQINDQINNQIAAARAREPSDSDPDDPAVQLVRSVLHGYPRQTVTGLQRHVAQMLDDDIDPEMIRGGLRRWEARSDARPGLLPHLVQDEIKASRPARPEDQPPSRGVQKLVNGMQVFAEVSGISRNPTDAELADVAKQALALGGIDESVVAEWVRQQQRARPQSSGRRYPDAIDSDFEEVAEVVELPPTQGDNHD